VNVQFVGSFRVERLPDATPRKNTMKKSIALATVALAAAVGTGYATHPDESKQLFDAAVRALERMWNNIETNPVPVLVALGTFLVTIAYHKAKGKSLRESVEFAATRIKVVEAPAPAAGEPEPAVVKRAQARATRTQLLADQFGLENRIRKLPDEVKKAEKETCYAEQEVTEAEQALTEAEQTLEAKLAANEAAAAKLEALRKELAAGESEIAAIAAELKRLADVV
jgi:predicted RNase H-like nuclease (RuvC/YqgF family)